MLPNSALNGPVKRLVCVMIGLIDHMDQWRRHAFLIDRILAMANCAMGIEQCLSIPVRGTGDRNTCTHNRITRLTGYCDFRQLISPISERYRD